MNISILLINIKSKKLENIKKTFKQENIKVLTAHSKKESIDIIKNKSPYLIIVSSFTDVISIDTIDIIVAAKMQDLYRPIIVLGNAKYRTKFLQMGVNIYCTDLLPTSDLITQSLNLLTLYQAKKFSKSQSNVLESLSIALEIRDPYTLGHGRRTSIYATAIYDDFGYRDSEDREALRVGCLIHDIGKVGTPDSILKSNEKLSIDNYTIIKNHPDDGVKICKSVIVNEKVLDIIEHHHEKIDGSGYPDGLMCNDICELTKIAVISDIYDALTSDRSYRTKHTPTEAIKFMDKFFLNEGKISEKYYKILKKLVLDGKFDKIK